MGLSAMTHGELEHLSDAGVVVLAELRAFRIHQHRVSRRLGATNEPTQAVTLTRMPRLRVWLWPTGGPELPAAHVDRVPRRRGAQ